MNRDNKQQGFFYLDHRTADGKHGIIIDTYVTLGNVHDSQPYIGRLEWQIQRFGLETAERNLLMRNNTMVEVSWVDESADAVSADSDGAEYEKDGAALSVCFIIL
jgi:hypothetical protein